MIRVAKKWRLPIVVALFFFTNFLIYSLLPTCVEDNPRHQNTITSNSFKGDNSELKRIKCLIEGNKKLNCLKDNKDVYLPFEKFLKKQFDLTGKLIAKETAGERFEYYTSYSKVRVPEKLDYSSSGPFGHFASYNVEIRERVRCISAEHNVPMSTQWDTIPYFYPIQIAQYALQHYSRYKADGPPKEITIEAEFDPSNNILEVTDSSDGGVKLSLHPEPEFIALSFWWKPLDISATYTILLKELRLNKTIIINYKHVDDRRCVWAESDFFSDDYSDHLETDIKTTNKEELTFSYSLGSVVKNQEFTHVIRDILVDTTKALSLLQMLPQSRKDSTQPGGLKIGDIRLMHLQFSGKAQLRRPILQVTKSHEKMFLRTSEWFVKNQNEHGGWSVPVMRSIADNKLILPAGWHSAMAQGHGLSVLTRAYFLTNDSRYALAAQKSLKLFNLSANDGGVKNDLFGYDWYEEYPTKPGTFVLNGFMYSLIGLYDFSTVKGYGNESQRLFDNGLNSLRTFLSLYDTGSGSIYDLRHLGLKSTPNIARWDYHAVHIYLLKWLYTITNETFFNEVADRWIGYAQGKKAKHN